MYTLRLISAILHRDRGAAVRDEALDLRTGELALVRAARRDPARALGLAGRDQRALVPGRRSPRQSTPRRRRDRRRIDRDPEGRLARAVAGARAARRRRGVPARRGARSVARRGGPSRRSSPEPASSPQACSPPSSSTARPSRQLIIAESMTRDRLAALAQIILAGARAARRARLVRRPPAATTSASTTRCSPPPAAGWCSSSRPGT